jgi:hypothetical protein
MARFGAGSGTRYDNDGCGNHIDRLRGVGKKPPMTGLPDFSTKLCLCCGKRKPRKGGTNPAKKGWKCADCKTKVSNVK